MVAIKGNISFCLETFEESIYCLVLFMFGVEEGIACINLKLVLFVCLYFAVPLGT